jgi:hypothetical protein
MVNFAQADMKPLSHGNEVNKGCPSPPPIMSVGPWILNLHVHVSTD